MSKKIVITGVSKGLGLELTEKLTESGHNVAGCSRSGSGHPSLAMCEKVDVSVYESAKAFADKVLSEFGTPDIIINNAALMNRPLNLWEIPSGEFKELMDVNVLGTVNIINAFMPSLIAAGAGVVVNMSSGWGRATSPHVAPYCASKFAVEGLTMAMAQEVPSGIAVVSLNPGFIDTEMVQGVFGKGSGAENPSSWAVKAAKYILNIGVSDNGHQLTVR